MGFRAQAFKAAITGRAQGLAQFFKPRFTAPPPRNTEEWLMAFETNPRLAPVGKIAGDLASATGKLYSVGRDGEKKEIESHPFLDFMKKPNPMPEISATALWKLHEIYLLLVGEGYALIERGRNGQPLELWPVPPHWVQETPSLGHPEYKVRNGNGEIILVPVEDMFVQKELAPINPYGRGLGVSKAVGDEVEADEQMTKYAKTVFYNDGTPPTLLSTPGLQKEQFERFMEKWNERHQGIGNAHKMGFIPTQATAIRLTDTIKDMDFNESRKIYRDFVNAHFSIPPEVLGIVENSNRATAELAKILYAENILSVRLAARQTTVNELLLPWFGSGLVYEYDDIIPQDAEFQLQKSKDGVASCAMTINEWRAANGEDAVPWGDALLMPVSAMITPVNELTSNERDPTPITPPERVTDHNITPPETLPEMDEDAKAVQIASEVSLNGAQVASLVNVVGQMAQGLLTRESAIAIITAAFPFSRGKAEEILGPAAAPDTQPPAAPPTP